MKRRGLSAWLITWECSGDHAKPPHRVAEILDPRLSSKRVREIVELTYHREALLSEKVHWRLRKGEQPYPAEFATVGGNRWEGQIICGHNPCLMARLVNDLVIGTDADGNETASWVERSSAREMEEKLRPRRSFTSLR